MSLSSSWRFSFFHAYGSGREREIVAVRRFVTRDLRRRHLEAGYITVSGLEWRRLIAEAGCAATPLASSWKNGVLAEACGVLRRACGRARGGWLLENESLTASTGA